MTEADTILTGYIANQELASAPQQVPESVHSKAVTLYLAEQHGSTMAPSHQSSPLLRLPAELRNRIYGYALYHGNIQFSPGRKPDHGPMEESDLALLRACRQIHSETSLIFYSINTFEFEWTFDIPRFAVLLAARHRNAVRSIRLQTGSIQSLLNGQGGVHAICTLSSLEQLHLRGQLDASEWDALEMTRLRADGKSIHIFAD